MLLGLTIGLMTLDEVNLELLVKCGNPKEKEYASKIIPIRKDGYFLLVSLLLANTVIYKQIDKSLFFQLLDNQRVITYHC